MDFACTTMHADDRGRSASSMKFVIATGQLWKLLLTLGGVLLGGTVILTQAFIQNIAGQDLTLRLVLLATLVTLVAFGGAAHLLRCPRCGLKLFWHAASTFDYTSWFSRFLAMTECPRCQFRRETPPSHLSRSG